MRLTAERAARRLSGPYTLVLADPPYYDEGALAAGGGDRRIGAGRTSDRCSCWSTSAGAEAPDALGPLPLYRSRRHGDTVVSIYAQEE